MDTLKEAVKLDTFIRTLSNGNFTASILADRCVKVRYQGTINYEHQEFEFVLIPVFSANIYIVDNLTLFNTVNLYYHKDAFAYFMLELSKYNVAMSKRLSKQ